ncbi:MAG: hypothetical protein ACP5IB_09075 [Thermoplasmata archaeon]
MIFGKQDAGIKSSLLHCPVEKFDRLFFSLMDHLNNLFTSNDPEDILKFYDYFDNVDQLIKWMRERPKGNHRIIEFNKENNDIIVVIPTMDVNGKFALACKNDIFNGLHIIFVESGYNNYYFNYAHNCNAGIKKAMEYSPKWIVLSNDDMYKIDDITILKEKLLTLNNNIIKVVFGSPTNYHSYPAMLSFPRLSRYILFSFLGKLRKYQLILEKKYKVRYFISPKKGSYRLFFRKIFSLEAVGNFCIFSSNFIRELDNYLLDETYINGGEDLDLALKIAFDKISYSRVEFSIGDHLGSSLGKNTPQGLRYLKGTPRRLRDIANMAYFNSKINFKSN